MQVFGFTNEDLSNAYERNNAMKQGERRILRRRSGLLTAAFVARDSGDRELLRDVQEEIKKYNRTEVGRLNRITSNTLNSSYKAKSRAIANSVNGITLNGELLSVGIKKLSPTCIISKGSSHSGSS